MSIPSYTSIDMRYVYMYMHIYLHTRLVCIYIFVRTTTHTTVRLLTTFSGVLRYSLYTKYTNICDMSAPTRQKQTDHNNEVQQQPRQTTTLTRKSTTERNVHLIQKTFGVYGMLASRKTHAQKQESYVYIYVNGNFPFVVFSKRGHILHVWFPRCICLYVVSILVNSLKATCKRSVFIVLKAPNCKNNGYIG